MKYFIFLFLFGLLLPPTAKAQFFQTGQDPSSIHWKQINTVNFQVIYPEEFENEAQRLSYILDKVYNYGSKTLNHKPRKISVILHTRTVNSNGLVGWAPKRIELFTTPNQQIYSQDWLEQLALHEFRHSVQMDKIQSEMPFLLKAILGEQATALVVGAYLPFWFLEGDAVVTETALSKSGRGRTAAFGMEYRAQLAENGKYSFDKSYLGSYKDFVPDHYKMGYLLVGKTREKYGAEIWDKTLDKIGSEPFSLTPMNSIMKKITGKGIKTLYNNTFDQLQQDYKQSLITEKTNLFAVISSKKKNYTQYLYPDIYHDSLVFAYRTSIDDIGRFVLIDPGKSEKVIYTPGNIFEESVSLQGNQAIWAEKRADVRWTHADRSVIQIYDIETDQKREIKYSNKLFCPTISPDLKTFAAVEFDPANDFYLSVFNIETGKLIDRFKTADNQYFITPCWDEKGEKLYVVCLSDHGKYLASFDLKTKLLEKLTATTFANLSNPVYASGKIYFSSDFSGKDNLYALDIETKTVQQVIEVPFGANYPAVSKRGKLIFSNYTSLGYQLATMDLSEKRNLQEIKDMQLQPDSLAEHLAEQEIGVPDFSQSKSAKYPSAKYSKVGHLINFHSWAPAFIDLNSYEMRPGFSLFSQNKLGTAETRIGYDYNVSNRTGQYKLNFIYSGIFPEISAELITGKQASNYLEKSDSTIRKNTWHESSVNLDILLPLNLSRGKYARFFFPEIEYGFNRLTHTETTPQNYYKGDYQALTYKLLFSNKLHQSSQNLMPRWGQQFDLIYRNTPFSGNDLGTLKGIESVLYFPGISKNDGLKIYQGYQDKVFSQSYTFSDFVRFPRGFQNYQNNKMYSLAVDYKFPFSYPDLSLGKLVYLKRLKSSLFYDFAWLAIPAKDENGKIYLSYHELNMKSMGIELTSDLHLLRFFAPIEIGLRTVYRPDYQDFNINLLLSVNFNGF